MNVVPPTLEGKYVRLEPMKVEHALALAQVGLGRDIFRYFRSR
jgi:hypothetical protein